MTSIKVKFRASLNEGREGTIVYQVIHQRKVRQIKSHYKIFSSEWDERTEHVTIPSYGDSRRGYLRRVDERIECDCRRLSRIVALLSQQRRDYSIDAVVEAYEQELHGVMLFKFMEGIIARLGELNRHRSSETYLTTLNSFMRFREGEDLLLVDITADIILDYEAYLKGAGLSMNTISFYMRILRAVYNRAVELELVTQTFPFKKVYTGVDKTIKRALTLKDIRQIKELDLERSPKLRLARDLFLFSFYTRGMSFVDMAYLRKSDLTNGVISYRRRKTGQRLHIKWELCMQEIIERYLLHESDYLLPIISCRGSDSRVQYRRMLSVVNRHLKMIGEQVGVTMPLTMYVARHSWASVARSRNVPISVISEGMGHDSESTTQIYLASLDTSIVDKANNLILKLL